MEKIADAQASTTEELWNEIVPRIEDAPSLEGAAHSFLDVVHERFGGSVALGRMFLTIAYSELPDRIQHWTANLARDKGVADALSHDTIVLSLVGTRGEEWAWNDIRKSKSHVGIPLVSDELVESVPMIARLLGDLGVRSGVGRTEGDGNTNRREGPRAISMFYVADARAAVDARKREAVFTRDFIEKYDIRTVFGVGGPYATRTDKILVCIFFTKEEIPRATAQLFEPLVEQFRNATTEFIETDNIFA